MDDGDIIPDITSDNIVYIYIIPDIYFHISDPMSGLLE